MVDGPVEFLMVEFPGTRLPPEITSELLALISAGTIRVLNAVFTAKTEDGELVDDGLEQVDVLSTMVSQDAYEGDLISPADVELASSNLKPGTSALLLLWEDLWATSLADALDKAGGIVMDVERVSLQDVESE